MNSLASKFTDVSNDLFATLIFSQIESVEAVCHFERKLNEVDSKAEKLANDVEFLKSKCSLLDETIAMLRNFVITSSLNSNLSQNLENKKSEIKAVVSSPFSTLSQVCYNFYEHETTNQNDFESNRTSTSSLSQYSNANFNGEINSDLKTNKNIEPEIENNLNDSFCSSCSNSDVKSPIFYTQKQISQLKSIIEKEENEFEEMRQSLKEIQRLFNKRVKYEVNKKFGKNYLAEHQVRELDLKEMHKIKKKVIKLFSPFPISVKNAWSNAMNSLRQDRHQLKKRKYKKY